MPDAATLLEQDHRKVETLFERFRNGDRGVVGMVCDELLVHTAVEEKVVYPALPEIERGADMKREAEEEHREVEQAVRRLREIAADSGEVDTLMETIMAGVTHHVVEEEGQVLPALRDGLGAERMAALGEAVVAAKRSELASMGALDTLTKDELYEMAQVAELPGRSDMTKGQLVDALRR